VQSVLKKYHPVQASLHETLIESIRTWGST
jgi:hypothetical protein